MKRIVLFLVLCVSCLQLNAAKPFFFVQITDPQLGFKEKNSIEVGVKLLTETVEAINRIHPDFVVVTGDMTNNRFSEEQWEAYRKLIGQIDKDIPVWHIPGNHDLKPQEEGDLEHYLARYGYDRFCFRHKGCAFIGANSCFLKDKCFAQEREHYIWLEEQLWRSRKARHVFVFTHCPVVKERVDEKEDYFNFQAPYRQLYLDLFRQYQVDAVFSGHLHRSRFCEDGGVPYYTTSASGLPLGDGTSGLNIVTVYPDHFTAEFVSAAEARNPLLRP
ncbi:MAG: metallophosphoesterase [Bacteroidales bacterium]|nr:metallophosphoesterase [Bacteroidales bacterium]